MVLIEPVFHFNRIVPKGSVLHCFLRGSVEIKPVFHFARIVPKPTGEHAQIEKRFINPRTSGCIRVSK
jgi:hypothetical protein